MPALHCFHYVQLVKQNKRLESGVIAVELALVTAWKNSFLGVFPSLNPHVYHIFKFQTTFLLFVLSINQSQYFVSKYISSHCLTL